MAGNEKRSKGERDAFHRGERDGKRGHYEGQSWADHVGNAIFGKSSERRAYETGVDRGRSPKKDRS